MSFSYDRYERQQRSTTRTTSRSTLTYWVPLVFTVTAATIGVATWIWAERRDNADEDEHREERRRRRSSRASPPLQTTSTSYGETIAEETTFDTSEYAGVSGGSEWRAEDEAEAEGILARMSGAIRRTPSPQKMLDYASRRVAAGVAAAGRGLSAITEEDTRADFVDHERWSEEQKVQGVSRGDVSGGVVGRGRRRTVAVVVEAEGGGELSGSDADLAQTSVLANIAPLVDPSTTDLLVLIDAPQLKTHPLATRPRRPSSDGGSSYENIATPNTEKGNALDTPLPDDDGALSAYNAVAAQALSLVQHPTSVLPFTSRSGFVHMLRHLAPNLVYVQETLCGRDGEAVGEIGGWVGQVVVLLGSGGIGAAIVDTETEDEGVGAGLKRERWWQDDARVGLGKGVEVVESVNFGEDWRKRVGGSM